MCYHVEIDRSVSKVVDIHVTSYTPKWTCLPVTSYKPLSTWVTMPTLIAVGQTARAGKTGFLASCLSRSLQVIGNDTDRLASYDFLLTFHSHYGPILYRFPDSEILTENCDFSEPMSPPPTPRGSLGIL